MAEIQIKIYWDNEDKIFLVKMSEIAGCAVQ